MTSAELEPVKPATLTERMDYARALAAAGLLPDVYRDKPANILYAMEYGAALGVPPITAIMGINVIAGKPTLSADLMAALIRRAHHTLHVWVDESKPEAFAELIRADDPEHTFRTRWDMERARLAGLTNKDNWKKSPLAMLKARAISEVAREGASEVLHGLIYTPEEMGANTDEDGAPIVDGHVVEDQPPPTRRTGKLPPPDADGVDRFVSPSAEAPQLHIRHKDGSREPLDLPDKRLEAAARARYEQARSSPDAGQGAFPPYEQVAERFRREVLAEEQPPLVDAFPDEPKETKP